MKLLERQLELPVVLDEEPDPADAECHLHDGCRVIR